MTRHVSSYVALKRYLNVELYELSVRFLLRKEPSQKRKPNKVI